LVCKESGIHHIGEEKQEAVRMVETIWEMAEEQVEHLFCDSEIEPLIQKILIQKGITSIDEMYEFLSPKPQKTYDPFLMKNMDAIVKEIIRGIEAQKSIWIYGDYDVDGITSIALLMEFLGKFTSNLNYYIPKREEEGYGLNCDAIQEIKNAGADLIITVDCGSTSVKEVELAKSLGMDIIITDHHNLSDEIPDCLILNPKQKDCAYPFSDLCGCGVVFKLVQALQREMNAPKKYLSDLLDLVALATVADVVPLIDENRTILKYGMRKINQPVRPGLKTLIERVGLKDKSIHVGHIGFIIAPHFNASGRIDDARIAVDLLLEKEQKKIEEIVVHLIRCNTERKAIQEEGLKICERKVEAHYLDDLFFVLDAEDTHEGVIGIIAGKIRDRYYRPVLVVTHSQEAGILKGSGRSIDGLDMYEEMKKCSDLFIKFGGHKNACGFSIQEENLKELRERLNQQASILKARDPDLFTKKIKIASELKPSEITKKLISQLKKLEPYGLENEKPCFLIRQLKIQPSPGIITMGKERNHLKFKAISNIYKDTDPVEIVGFDMAEFYIDRLDSPDIVDVVGFPIINEWNGYENIQFLIDDMK